MKALTERPASQPWPKQLTPLDGLWSVFWRGLGYGPMPLREAEALSAYLRSIDSKEKENQ